MLYADLFGGGVFLLCIDCRLELRTVSLRTASVLLVASLSLSLLRAVSLTDNKGAEVS